MIFERHCRESDRDPVEVAVSANAFLIVEDDADRAAAARDAMGERGGLVGTPDQILSHVASYAEAGVEELVIAGFNHTAQGLPGELHRLSEILARG